MLKVGDTAPPLKGTDALTGQPFDLADHAGKGVMVFFADLWNCEPCKAEATMLELVWGEVKTWGVQFVMVHSDWEDEAHIKVAAEYFGLTFPVIRDSDSLFEAWLATPGGGDWGPYPTTMALRPGHPEPASKDRPAGRHEVCHVHIGLPTYSPVEYYALLAQRIKECMPVHGVHAEPELPVRKPHLGIVEPCPLPAALVQELLTSLELAAKARELATWSESVRMERAAMESLVAAAQRLQKDSLRRTEAKVERADRSVCTAPDGDAQVRMTEREPQAEAAAPSARAAQPAQPGRPAQPAPPARGRR